jgi:sortase (surface protein transpeptidase)
VQTSEPGEDVAEPTGVRIPAIGVEQASLTELGLKDDGAMEVPDFGDAGWYERGPKPGEPGGAVIAAHYDSTDGPDVFYDLAELERGDVVEVDAADGRTGVWRVVDSEQTPKDELPGDRLWPGGDEPQLALITCGGVFDDSTGHYTHNEIVYAEWQGWREA